MNEGEGPPTGIKPLPGCRGCYSAFGSIMSLPPSCFVVGLVFAPFIGLGLFIFALLNPRAASWLAVPLVAVVGLVMLLGGLTLWLLVGRASVEVNKMLVFDPVARAKLVDQLEQLGFFKYVDESNLAMMKRSSLDEPAFLNFATQRFIKEPESHKLANGGVAEFLTRIEPLLTLRGVKLDAVEQNYVQAGAEQPVSSYNVTINGANCLIYTAEEAAAYPLLEDDEDDEDYDQYSHLWCISNVNTYRLIDDLLTKAGSDERTYRWVRNGMVLLTPAMEQLIRSSNRALPAFYVSELRNVAEITADVAQHPEAKRLDELA